MAIAALAGCAGSPSGQRYASMRELGGVDPRYGVRPSPRVVEDGEEVPQGGGRYQVGKPYKIAGKTYYPSERPYAAVGTASWYGSDFHGRRTANGEVFDRNSLSAAHPTMPLPSYARVTNMNNAHSIVVRVNDRGPYHGGRVMDVSQRVAEALDFHRVGTARVKVEWIGRADLSGSDNAALMASLRTDGSPAALPGMEPPVMVAEEPAPARSRIAYAQPPRRPADIDELEAAVAPPAPPPPAARPTMEAAAETEAADRAARAAAEEIMSKDRTAYAEEAGPGVDDTPVKSIRASRSAAPPLPPVRPSRLGSSGSRQAMN
ncbi:septal ring lytic transglycosylase RlpA family protein [Methylocystis heyeri]|nr:septal ring lytic transglycosylase RlpA family protein [Methylocystis heyeri]